MESDGRSSVRGIANHRGDKTDGVVIIIIKSLMNGDNQIHGFAYKISKSDGIGIHCDGVSLQRNSHLGGGGLLQADNLLGVEGVRTSHKTIGILVLEVHFAGSGSAESDVEIGIDIAINSTSHIKVASLVCVEILHSILIY